MKGLPMTATSVTTLKKNIVFTLLCGTVLMMFVAGSTAASAQSCPTPNYSPDFSNVSNQACLKLNGNLSGIANSTYPAFVTTNPTPTVATVLRLTPNQFFWAGSAWYKTPQPVAGAFSTTFTFELTGTTPEGSGNADGIAFVIQNSSAGTGALGPNGCGIGFGGDSLIGCTSGSGITNSLAVEFNTFNNGTGVDPSNNDVTIQNCSGTGANSVDSTCSIAVNSNLQTTGTVTTSGTTVTWASGNLFNTSWAAGTGIVINDSPFTVASVASTTSLTVTAAPPTYSNPTSYSVAITLADGNVHTVTINYSGPGTTLLDVILDGNDLFAPSLTGNAYDGVLFNLATIGGNGCSNSSCPAYVGFTAATGGGDDNQDILSWTFSPGAQSAALTVGVTSTLSFPNAAGTNVYDYTAKLTTPYANPVLSVQPILSTKAACDALVQKNFWPARCFVYENAENPGLNVPVMFAVTCPTAPNGTCGSTAVQNFFATLGTDFEFSFADNPFFVYPGIFSLLNPFPGWLKGVGNDPLNPCDAPVFTSNQISSFVIDGGRMTGGSGGTGSCWVATYDTPGEVGPGLQAGPGIKITSPKGSYPPNTVVNASYTCSNPSTSKPLSSATGPYLTANSCKQSTGTQGPCPFTPIIGSNLGGLSCTGTFTTPAKKGTYTFGVTAIDSGSNQNLGAVTYTVTSH